MPEGRSTRSATAPRTRAAIAAAFAALLALALTAAQAAPATAGAASALSLSEYRLSDSAAERLRTDFVEGLLAEHPAGTWAPMKMELTDEQLALMGLPPAHVLKSRTYEQPTMVTADGQFTEVSMPALATFAGTGYFGIRPGAWVLLLSGGGVGWCSLAHVFGSPGSHDISTAGHCGKTGDRATVIAAFGNSGGAAGPVLLDIGRFATSQDGGLGADWALIDLTAAVQHLVTPTMPVWGGPRGTYTKTGSVVSVSVPNRLPAVPGVSVTPDPLLAQTIVHYGHGTGVGAGGTPRAGEAISWSSRHYMFFGAISPGDSGSGANTLAGDTVGANMEAAGIMTHLWIDPLMRSGLGIMGGTRTTVVKGALADGQYIPYPVPAPGLP
jgi:hypothetical protein